MLEDFKVSFNPKKLTVKIESEGSIGVVALYRKIREWEAGPEGIVFPEILEGVNQVTLPGGDQTAAIVIFVNGWRLEADVKVWLVGGLVDGKEKNGSPQHPVEESSRDNIILLSKDRDFIPTEAQLQHVESEAEAFAEDWEIISANKAIQRRTGASSRVHTVLGLYWFLKKSRLNEPDLRKFTFPLTGDNRPPAAGLVRRWDLDSSWTIREKDLQYLTGGPLVHHKQILIPALENEERKKTQSEAEATARREATTIGIMTALPEELATVRAQLDDIFEYTGRRGDTYFLGRIPARNSGFHNVALTMTDMGNNQAATKATAFLYEIPSISEILMVGIAGAVPNPTKVEEHVRLGDIVVSGPHGVVQYDYVKETCDFRKHRYRPRPPSKRFSQVIRLMQADMLTGEALWNAHLARCSAVQGTQRPSPDKDCLADTLDLTKFVTHPVDPNRKSQSVSRLFVGTIGAANILLKNPVYRDKIRDRFDVRAVEMESSGMADSAFELEVNYFVIRGTCDYCDANKNDDWHGYAAAVAASFLAAMLQNTPVIEPRTY